ncbi:MAG TPA: 50S ribosomal protein L15 [Armatimonadota bacterium]|nr:50S ribosomal protein L15 [Armatimonadota bacterium]
MNPGSIRKPAGNKSRRRVGRGRGSGFGKTCGRGQKGQLYRTSVPPHQEGGQNPIYRRIPHYRGNTNRAMNIGMFRKSYTIVNLSQLAAKFEANAEVTPEILGKVGLVKQVRDGVKILGNGEISQPLNVTVHAISTSAKEKIEAAGGTVQVIGR